MIARQQARTGRCHAFSYACEKHGIEHRLTRPYHPWTNGQVERTGRTLKEATVHRYHYASHDDLRGHVQLFLDAYNHARRLKALRGLTPYEFTCQVWTREPERFRIDRTDPSHHTLGPNSITSSYARKHCESQRAMKGHIPQSAQLQQARQPGSSGQAEGQPGKEPSTSLALSVAGVGVHPDVQPAPGPSDARAVLLKEPLVRSAQLQPCVVQQQVRALCRLIHHLAA